MVLEVLRMCANGFDVGARGRVQRSVRIYECESREVDSPPAHRVGRHLCLAAVPPSRLLHQAETYMKKAGQSIGAFLSVR